MIDIYYLVPGVGLHVEEKDRREHVINELTSADVDVAVIEEGGPDPTTIKSVVEEFWCTVESM